MKIRQLGMSWCGRMRLAGVIDFRGKMDTAGGMDKSLLVSYFQKEKRKKKKMKRKYKINPSPGFLLHSTSILRLHSVQSLTDS